jgi:hypothetical protein
VPALQHVTSNVTTLEFVHIATAGGINATLLEEMSTNCSFEVQENVTATCCT